jgi:tubulin polyglutamylase TTLL6/13
MHLTNYSLNK